MSNIFARLFSPKAPPAATNTSAQSPATTSSRPVHALAHSPLAPPPSPSPPLASSSAQATMASSTKKKSSAAGPSSKQRAPIVDSSDDDADPQPTASTGGANSKPASTSSRRASNGKKAEIDVLHIVDDDDDDDDEEEEAEDAAEKERGVSRPRRSNGGGSKPASFAIEVKSRSSTRTSTGAANGRVEVGSEEEGGRRASVNKPRRATNGTSSSTKGKQKAIATPEADDDDSSSEDGAYNPSVEQQQDDEDQLADELESSDDDEPVQRKKATSSATKNIKKEKGKGKAKARTPVRMQARQTTYDSSSDGEVPEAELETDAYSRKFALLRVESAEDDDDQSVNEIRIGDALEINSDGEGADTWIIKVDKLRGLKSDLTDAVNGDGTPRVGSRGQPIQSCATTWIKGLWYYSKRHFQDLPYDWRWTRQVEVMGPLELISTNHPDWMKQSRAKKGASSASKVVMLKFDDTYPAPNPSTGVLAPHPLEVARSHKHRDNPVLPPYYLGEIDKADKTSFSYTPYYRVELEFGVPKAEQQKIDREAAAKEARKGVKGRQPGKKKSASVAMPKKGKNVGGSLPDGKALYFNRHSISRSPYDPQHVQHYSPFARTWYSTSELEKHDHVVALSRGNELAQLMDGPDDSDDSDFEAPVASSSKRTLGSTATSPKKKPRFDNTLDAFLTRVRADDRPLGQLAASSIVRGGAYGLIGNAFLVQKARDLLLDEAFDPDDDDEAQEYVNGWEEWKKVVASRVKRGKGDGKPPKGHVWACPKTGKEI